jgi:hypothetical protein
MTTVEAPSETRTYRNRSVDEGRAVDYREEAKRLAAEDYQARIRRSTARGLRIRSRRGVRACSAIPVFKVAITSPASTGSSHRVHYANHRMLG